MTIYFWLTELWNPTNNVISIGNKPMHYNEDKALLIPILA